MEYEYTIDTLTFLYTGTSTGKNSGIKFMLTVEDAQKFCSDPRTAGQLYGSEWAYFYTTVREFLYRGKKELIVKKIDITKIVDNNSFDPLLAELGCKKIPIEDFHIYLEPLGIEVKGLKRKAI